MDDGSPSAASLTEPPFFVREANSAPVLTQLTVFMDALKKGVGGV
jgi:hypothetical protein